jgi:hypothetical protein
MVAKSQIPFDDFSIERDFPKIGHRKMLLRGRPLDHGGERGTVLLEVTDDDSSRKSL